MKRVWIVLLILAANTVMVIASCPDVTEPNDSSSQAFPLVCDGVLADRVGAKCIDPAGDVDFFSVNLLGGQAFAFYSGSGDNIPLRISFYDRDGVTLLEQAVLPTVTDSFGTTVSASGTYFFSVDVPTAQSGQYSASVRCRDVLLPPPSVDETLRAVKTSGDIVLSWAKPSDTSLDPPTSYEVWRGLPTTSLYFDLVGPAPTTTYDVGPLASRPQLEYYRVRSRNKIGLDRSPAAFVRLSVEPADAILDPGVRSATACDVPNLHPQLPHLVTVSVQDRFRVPLNGHAVNIQAANPDRFGTFCPPPADPFYVSGQTGDSGPGVFSAAYALAEWERCLTPAPRYCRTWFFIDVPEFEPIASPVFLRW